MQTADQPMRACAPCLTRPSRLGALITVLVLVMAAAPTPPTCDASPGAEGAAMPLPHLAAARAAGRLRVLVLGSGSVAAARDGGGEGAFPISMAAGLRRSIPDVELTLKGGRGATASDMKAQMAESLAAHPADLVVWQTGTVEALRNAPPGAFARTLSDGASIAAQANADLIVLDFQYSRVLARRALLAPYEDAFHVLAAKRNVGFFRRFDLTRAWTDSGVLDLERAAQVDRAREAADLHDCVGERLAAFVLAAAR